MRKPRQIVLTLVSLVALAIASSAVAGNGGNAKSSSSISVVVMSAARTADGTAQHGDQVTFAVSTNATDRPNAPLDWATRMASGVLSGQAGFWASYPSKTFTLASTWWTGGAASCTATLGSINADGTRFRELASTSFTVTG